MKTLALSAARLSADSPGPAAPRSPATRAGGRAGGPPIAFAADAAPAWTDTQPGYHVRPFHELAPGDAPGPPPQV